MSEQIRKDCESSLYTYAQVMFPERYFGDVHEEMFHFFQKSLETAMEKGEGDNAAALVPRDHQKSFCIAVACSWAITKHPWFTVTYVSSNPTLAERQLTVIKNIFKSDNHRELWPAMMNYEINPRSKEYEHKPTGTWTKTEIGVDHPERPKSEKDPTVAATSAKSTNTGAHYKMCIFDDLVTNENYRSAAEREDIKEVYQSYASIATTGSIKWMVGTRYGDNDLYSELKTKEYYIYDDVGNIEETRPLWKWFERTIEDSKNKDGSGTYVWPRAQMPDGSWYGFNQTELSKKRSEAFNLELFFAQYYNDPNAADVDKITKENFMYLQPNMLENRQGKWFYGTKELKIACGMDLAFSEGSGVKKTKRDFTSIAVIAWDGDGYLYILDLQRFQTVKAEVYYEKLIELHAYWDFREATIETNSGGSVVATFIQDELRRAGHTLVIKHQHKNQKDGSKEERNSQLFEPLYRTKSVYHTKGGFTRLLEEELRLTRPPHDDLKDAVWIAVSNSKRPSKPKFATNKKERNVVNANSRFLNRRKRA
ncbi:MAG: putative terminase large subunit [Prokaryotic dsDNA virus sp.]|nr:MAG: putative terminase large subunit [Prokaryotic dsDNA virus sp.]|tara:strand:- start:4275 stop:5885 length:1611 start_codon:yes stop_codon:yes gene_type:complete